MLKKSTVGRDVANAAGPAGVADRWLWSMVWGLLWPLPAWILPAIYHNSYSPVLIATVLVFSLAFLFSLASLMQRFLGQLAWQHVRDSSLFVLAMFLAQSAIRAEFSGGPALPKWVRLLLSVLALLLALGLPRMWLHSWYFRVRRATITFIAVFSIAPLAWSEISAPAGRQVFASLARQEARIYLVLDELGSHSAEAMLVDLKARGWHVAHRSTASVGTDTIHVLPQMFGAPAMLDAKVCGATAICGTSSAFDFGRLQLKADGLLHMVGFYHPYCSAQGWASCTQVEMNAEAAWHSYACTFARLVPDGWRMCDWVDVERWTNFKRRYLAAVWQSPFWNRGGSLVLHAPLPHPPGPATSADLRTDYAANLQQSAEFVNELLSHAKQRFGDNFQLLLTSDHPLRPNVWCSTIHYRKTGCSPEDFAQDKQVPFALVGPRFLARELPPNNSTLFSR